MRVFPPEVIDRAEKEARRRFSERAEEFRDDLESACFELLPGNHSPADIILLAHLMTASAGFHHVEMICDWSRRPMDGWQTSFCQYAEIGSGLCVKFAFETRHRTHARQLAVLLDSYSPGERLPGKRDEEGTLIALGFRVLVFTDLEVTSDPENCRSRVEHILAEMSDDVLADEGLIRGRVTD